MCSPAEPVAAAATPLLRQKRDFLFFEVRVCLMIMIFTALISFLIVSFGQPVWSSWLGSVAAVIGYALFFASLLNSAPRRRFWLGALFGTGVQMVQLSWLLSHPYWYIYAVHFGLSFMAGMQFGFLSLLISRRNLEQLGGLLAIASIWTIMEWSRLFYLAGFSFNPAGMALAGNLYSLQMASLGGAFGLTFWVLFVNLFALHIYVTGWNLYKLSALTALAALPYCFGFYQLHFLKTKEPPAPFHVVLVQTAFPAEEVFSFETHQEMVDYVLGEWRQIFTNLKEHYGKPVDLVVLPEAVVPFGTYSFVFDFEKVKAMLMEIYGDVTFPSGMPYVVDNSLVNNAFFSATIANLFQSGVVIGLEDASDVYHNGVKTRRYYSSAQYFQPGKSAERYEKRILVPMGEYIPFSFLSDLCASYGIQASLTPGASAKIMQRKGTRFGLTICYEEMFGDMMRENKQLGADLLVNITSDVWYPDSLLPQQHFDHAKLRTVEMGIPLARACNTGVTGVIDCFGRNIAILGEGDKHQEWLSEALYVDVPMKSYWTLYSKAGDALIVALSFVFSLFFLQRSFFRRSVPMVKNPV